MQGISAKLDWGRMLGFEQMDRAAVQATCKTGAKVGDKVGVKFGLKRGSKR